MTQHAVGIIGAGMIFQDHAAAYATLKDKVVVRGVADIDPAALERAARQLEIPFTTRDYRQLLERADIDVIDICTPHALHERMIIEALEAGKYVLCEKPLAHTWRSAQAILAASRRFPGKLAIIYQVRYATWARQAMALNEAGLLGRLLHGRLTRYTPTGSLAARYGYGWGRWAVEGGGYLINNFIHQLDILCLLFGPPKRVSASLATLKEPFEAEDTFTASIEFANGALVVCNGSAAAHRGAQFLDVIGEKASIHLPWSVAASAPEHLAAVQQFLAQRFSTSAGQEPRRTGIFQRLVHKGKRALGLPVPAAPRPAPSPPEPNLHALYFQDFFSAIEGNGPMPVSPEAALISLELCLAIYAAAMTGEMVELPLNDSFAYPDGITADTYRSRQRIVRKTAGTATDGDVDTAPQSRHTEKSPTSSPPNDRPPAIIDRQQSHDLRAPLAIAGGDKVRTRPFPSWPVWDERERANLIKILESGTWGIGNAMIPELEQRFARLVGAKYAICVTNGTAALEIALRAAGVSRGDEVIVPPYTFMATASAVLMVNAIPVFVDISDIDCNLDPDRIEMAISPRTKAIIPVHIGGCPADMERIMAIAHRHNLVVIEDCAQAHGAAWKDQPVGSIGDMGCFSFQSSKNMSAGEGGIITTNSPDFADKCWSYHNCGRKREGAWYEHHVLGSNFRMTGWQAAVLLAQLERLADQMERRNANADYLAKRLAAIDGIIPLRGREGVTRHAHHLFIFRYQADKFGGVPRERFLAALNAEGIPCSAGYPPLYGHPLFQASIEQHPEVYDWQGGPGHYAHLSLPVTERICKEEVVWLTQNILLGEPEDMDDVVAAIEKIHYAFTHPSATARVKQAVATVRRIIRSR